MNRIVLECGDICCWPGIRLGAPGLGADIKITEPEDIRPDQARHGGHLYAASWPTMA